MVMDYIEGESLDKILKGYGAQPEELVTGWAMQLCDALSYLHSQNPPIIYRDMKPANVMLKPEGNIKIIDFGIAREYKEQNLADTTVLGTKGYAPPEQYSGQTRSPVGYFCPGHDHASPCLRGWIPAAGRLMHPSGSGIRSFLKGSRSSLTAAWNLRRKTVTRAVPIFYMIWEHPELITRGFKKKQKRKLAAFLAAAGLAVVHGSFRSSTERRSHPGEQSGL